MMQATHLKLSIYLCFVHFTSNGAVRIQTLPASELTPHKSTQAEAGTRDWHLSAAAAYTQQEIDSKCKWKPLRASCGGDGCKLRPLPLDRSLSEACRLSDEYMLRNATIAEEFVKLKAVVLEEKTRHFKEKCVGRAPWYKRLTSRPWKCWRRIGRIMQASKFLVNAGQIVSTADQSVQKNIESAMQSLASAYGSDFDSVKELFKKLIGNFINVAKEPETWANTVLESLSGLLSVNQTERVAARENIGQIPEGTLSNATPSDIAQAQQAAEDVMNKFPPKHDMLPRIEDLLSNGGETLVPSTLLQVASMGEDTTTPPPPTTPPPQQVKPKRGPSDYVCGFAWITLMVVALWFALPAALLLFSEALAAAVISAAATHALPVMGGAFGTVLLGMLYQAVTGADSQGKGLCAINTRHHHHLDYRYRYGRRHYHY